MQIEMLQDQTASTLELGLAQILQIGYNIYSNSSSDATLLTHLVPVANIITLDEAII